jgi:hypothetical protein
MGNEVEARTQRVRNHLQRPDHPDRKLTSAKVGSIVNLTVPGARDSRTECARAVAGATTLAEWSVAGSGVEVGPAESGSRRRQEDVMQNENDCGISKWRMRAQAVRAAIALVVATMPPVNS